MYLPWAELFTLAGIASQELAFPGNPGPRPVVEALAGGGAAEADEVPEEGGLQGERAGGGDLRQPQERVAGGGEAAAAADPGAGGEDGGAGEEGDRLQGARGGAGEGGVREGRDD